MTSTTASAEQSRRSSVLWCLASCFASVALAAARLIDQPRYYFADDTQAGATGIWYAMGQRLFDGEWFTFLDPGAWQAGNLLAEGQWGLFSPVMLMVAVASQGTTNLVALATIVKLVFFAVMAAGVFVLARSFGASAAWSAVAGLTMTTTGQIAYIDSASWVTGFQTAALFPWTWWALRRHVVENRGPAAFFVAAGLLITIGYVAPVLILVLLFLAVLVEAAARRNAMPIAQVLLLGAYSAGLCLLMFLPSLMSASVTGRQGGVFNNLLMTTDLGDLLVGGLSTGLPTINLFHGVAEVPVSYLGWFLPLLAVLWARSWRQIPPTLTWMALCTLFFLLAPSDLGPLRFPLRMQPFLALVLVVLFAVLATRATQARSWTARDRAVARGLLAVVTCAAAAASPGNIGWVLVGAGIQAALQELLMRSWSTEPSESQRFMRRVPHAALLGSAGLGVLMMVQAPATPMPDYGLPGVVGAYAAPVAGGADGVMTVGDWHALTDQEGFDETVFANAWYLTGWTSPSSYTVLRHQAYSDQLCAAERGETCPEAVDRLFALDEDGRMMADDLLLNTVVVVRDGLTSRPEPVAGWTVEDHRATWIVRRDQQVERAGGVLRSDGVEATVVEATNEEVTIRLDAVDTDGGSLTLSRIDWPGYVVNGPGRLTDPERGFLLTVEVEPGAAGEEIVVAFRPPAWTLSVAGGVGALVIAVCWTAAYPALRRRGQDPSASQAISR